MLDRVVPAVKHEPGVVIVDLLDQHVREIQLPERGDPVRSIEEHPFRRAVANPDDRRIHWYATAETVPGPITERLSPYAKKYKMVLLLPIYEMEQEGVYYNCTAVIDADGSYLGKFRKIHIPHTWPGFWDR